MLLTTTPPLGRNKKKRFFGGNGAAEIGCLLYLTTINFNRQEKGAREL
jgi:hypothetical protein